MGDSGALLLGFTLAAVSVQGMLKTAALATLVLPLLVLAVPLLDTSFVVARRIKYGQPFYVADRQHLHHRFEQVGFSQRRAVLYLYGWCLTLALAALATRFVHPHPHGQWDPVNVADRRRGRAWPRSPRPSTSSTCSRSSSSRTRSSAGARSSRAPSDGKSPSRAAGECSRDLRQSRARLRSITRLALSHSPGRPRARLRYAAARWSRLRPVRFRLLRQAPC